VQFLYFSHEEVRIQFRRKIVAAAPDVFRLVNQWAEKLIDSNNEELKNLNAHDINQLKSCIIESLFSWVLLNIKENEFKVIGEECHFIIELIFEELSTERDNYINAASLIGELLVLCKRLNDRNLSEILKKNLQLLITKWDNLVQSEDIEAIETYAGMFTDLADVEMKNIVEGSNIEILEIIVKWFEVNGRHFKSVTGVLKFFCEILEESFPNKSERDQKIAEFKHIFEHMLQWIISKSKMTKDKFLDFNHKNEAHPDFDDLFKIRHELGQLIKKIGLCIGHYELYELLITNLHEMVSGENADLDNLDNIVDLENLLYVMSFSIQLIDSHEEIKNFSALLNLMFKIPGDRYAALRRTVIDIIFIVSTFLRDLDENTINIFLEYVVEGFKSKSTFDVSSQWFERMIVLNMKLFASHLDKFVEHLQEISKYCTTFNPVWAKCHTAVLTLAINVLGNSPDEFKQAFQCILNPFTTSLLQEDISPSQTECCLEYIATLFNVLFKNIKDYGLLKQPFREILIEFWPILLSFMEKYFLNEQIIESSSRIMKYSLRAVSQHTDVLDELVRDYLTNVAEMYQKQPASWLIYPVEIWCPLYCKKGGFDEIFVELLQFYVDKTFEYLGSLEKIKQEPYIAADILTLITKFLKNRVDLVFLSKSFENIMEFSILWINIEHDTSNKALCNFHTQIFKTLKDIRSGSVVLPIEANRVKDIAEYAFEKGKTIVEKNMLLLLNVPLKQIQEHIVEFMIDLIVIFPSQAVEWINNALAYVPNDCLSDQEKQDFCRDFEFGEDSVFTIRKQFTVYCHRSSQRMLRGIH
jgi:hypothetical protein